VAEIADAEVEPIVVAATADGEVDLIVVETADTEVE